MISLIATCIIGIITGLSISTLILSISIKRNTVGSLRIDHSISYDDPYLFLELRIGPKAISKKKYVLMKIKNEDFITQK